MNLHLQQALFVYLSVMCHLQKGLIPPEFPRKTNAQKIAEVMQATHDRSPLIDLPLQKVLKTRKTSAKSRTKAKAEQAQAHQLLNNVSIVLLLYVMYGVWVFWGALVFRIL